MYSMEALDTVEAEQGAEQEVKVMTMDRIRKR